MTNETEMEQIGVEVWLCGTIEWFGEWREAVKAVIAKAEGGAA